MLDRDLAELYGVTTGNLNKAVKRNIRRFPCDFMFQLTKEEWDSLRFQIGILDVGRGKYAKFLPHAFTEQCSQRDDSPLVLLFSYLHHQTLTFNHLTSAFIRHKTSYPNQVSGLCSQRDPPVSIEDFFFTIFLLYSLKDLQLSEIIFIFALSNNLKQI
jgi:hypothetical protein